MGAEITGVDLREPMDDATFAELRAALLSLERLRVLEIRGGEAHNGSHSPYAKQWCHTGGGALLRLGAHPVGAMIYLKRVEGEARGTGPIRPVAVSPAERPTEAGTEP